MTDKRKVHEAVDDETNDQRAQRLTDYCVEQLSMEQLSREDYIETLELLQEYLGSAREVAQADEDAGWGS